MAHTLTEVLAALEARTGHVPRSVGGGWLTRCPVHDDQHPSLSIAAGERRPVIVHSHAGCDWRDVLTAVGLAPPIDEADPDPTERVHPYVDTSGNVVYEMRRGRDGHRWWRPDGHGGFARGLGDVPRILYRLPDLLRNADMPVWVCEGERDADTVARTCGCATAMPTWAKTDLTPLRDRTYAYVVADNDSAGFAKARRAGTELANLGVGIITYRRPPDTYKDVTEAFAHGKDCGDLLEFNPHTGQPPVETWRPTTERCHTPDGRELFGMVPRRVVLLCSPVAIAVFAVLDELSPSGWCVSG